MDKSFGLFFHLKKNKNFSAQELQYPQKTITHNIYHHRFLEDNIKK